MCTKHPTGAQQHMAWGTCTRPQGRTPTGSEAWEKDSICGASTLLPTAPSDQTQASPQKAMGSLQQRAECSSKELFEALPTGDVQCVMQDPDGHMAQYAGLKGHEAIQSVRQV